MGPFTDEQMADLHKQSDETRATCETCKHWGWGNQRIKTGSTEYRKCTNDCVQVILTGGCLFPHQDFGCSEYEEKVAENG
jgi:hypothetical protein